MSDHDDFTFVCGLISKFCGNRTIRAKYKSLADIPLKGWEKWFQIEFSLFLHNRSDIEWDRECGLPRDGRKSAHTKAFVDFYFRRKYTDTPSRIALEVKLGTSLNSCLDGMIKDWVKQDSLRPSLNQANWLLGFYPSENHLPKDAIIERANKKIPKMCKNHKIPKVWEDTKLNPQNVESSTIGRSGYAYIIF
ncbi:MAG: hypothetical protein WAN11_14700 [Syntrophobacteraceae bacterium]